MAESKAQKEKAESTNYLGQFKQLGPNTYFYHPMLNDVAGSTSRSDTSTVPQPNIIIICSWMAALPRHIAKYTDTYLTQHPQIPTLLVRSSQRDIMLRGESDQLKGVSPAISAIQSVFGSLNDEPRVLLHIFSNGGSWSAGLITKAYQQATAGLKLPITALILDSCPSLPHMRLSHLALTAALPKNAVIRFIGSMMIWIFLAFIRLLNELKITENFTLKVRTILNDPSGSFLKHAPRRVYICSKTDAMIPLKDVKQHAEEAKMAMRKTGMNDNEVEKRVTFEEFQGSAHVGHLMVDKERYWKIVERVWNEGMKLQTSRLDSLRR